MARAVLRCSFSLVSQLRSAICSKINRSKRRTRLYSFSRSRCYALQSRARIYISARADSSARRCYAISALRDSPERSRVSSLLARLSPSRPRLALCSFVLSLSVSQLNNSNNSLLLLEYLAPLPLSPQPTPAAAPAVTCANAGRATQDS